MHFERVLQSTRHDDHMLRRPSKPLHFPKLRGEDMDHLQHSAAVRDLDDFFGLHSGDMLRRRLYDRTDERTDERTDHG